MKNEYYEIHVHKQNLHWLMIGIQKQNHYYKVLNLVKKIKLIHLGILEFKKLKKRHDCN